MPGSASVIGSGALLHLLFHGLSRARPASSLWHTSYFQNSVVTR